mmetsp:Transcript_6964/g.14551  ORF Transcript_6964/g.14551 Transcript_6964/m.14551 type:complete len:129 (-) Transcript_6964:299-685(-)
MRIMRAGTGTGTRTTMDVLYISDELSCNFSGTIFINRSSDVHNIDPSNFIIDGQNWNNAACCIVEYDCPSIGDALVKIVSSCQGHLKTTREISIHQVGGVYDRRVIESEAVRLGTINYKLARDLEIFV